MNALGIDGHEMIGAEWVDNGPGWLALLLRDSRTVPDLEPEISMLGGLKVGVIGPTLSDLPLISRSVRSRP